MTPTSLAPKVAVLFDNFGPYHLARLKAAAKQFRLLAIEQRLQSQEYLWQVSEDVPFNRVFVLDGKDTDISRSTEQALLIEKLNEFEPDVVVIPGWASRQAVTGLAWAKANRVPAVVMSDSQEIDSTRSSWSEWLKSRVVGLCSAGLVGGTPHKAYLEKLGMPTECIRKGYDVVDNGYFSEHSELAKSKSFALRPKHSLPERYFLASNRFIPKKNLRRLLEAYADYAARSDDAAWGLVMLGDGALKSELMAQVDRLGLSTHVQFPGFKQYDELPIYYALASVFIQASTSEQWGLVVNEAMASGLPVLVSDRCGCAPDLVKNGVNGWTFDPFDTQQLTELMHSIAHGNTDLLAMGAASREIIQHWSPQTFAASMGEAVSAALNANKPPFKIIDKVLLWLLMHR